MASIRRKAVTPGVKKRRRPVHATGPIMMTGGI
jgi:hypothetical protein